MLQRDQMPEDNADLAKINVELPPAPARKLKAPETFLADVSEYLDLEGYIHDAELKFIRTALVDTTVYYIWSFESVGDPCFVTVSIGQDGSQCIGCDENYWGLSPEQFIMADYHNCL
jgi:hypothetical protein